MPVNRSVGQRLLERYGMTETGMILSNHYRGERKPGCVGFPLPGVTVRSLDGGAPPAKTIFALASAPCIGVQYMLQRKLLLCSFNTA